MAALQVLDFSNVESARPSLKPKDKKRKKTHGEPPSSASAGFKNSKFDQELAVTKQKYERGDKPKIEVQWFILPLDCQYPLFPARSYRLTATVTGVIFSSLDMDA
jgi:hypothetical protein